MALQAAQSVEARAPEPDVSPDAPTTPRPQSPSSATDGASPPVQQAHLSPSADQELRQRAYLSADSSPLSGAPADGSQAGEKSPGAAENQAHQDPEQSLELRFLVRRREAGALIGKRGLNIKRLRETFRCSMFSIPDTGNGPERVVCIVTNERSLDAILVDLTELLMEKSPENDDQIELKILIHSSHAGSIIGIGGQSIKKLRNDSKAAIKIYEMCCPLSNERVCAIKAKPPVVVSTIKLIQSILRENPTKGTVKPYDALHFDLNLVDKYGGYLHDDAALDLMGPTHHHHHQYDSSVSFSRQMQAAEYSAKRYSLWRSPDFRETCQLHESPSGAGCHQLDHHQLMSPEVGNLCAGKVGEHNGMKRDSADSCPDPQKANPQVGPNYPAQLRLGRYHPYAMRAANHLEFAPYARQPIHQPMPSNPYLRFHYGSPLQHRNPYVRVPSTANVFSGLPERCRNHARPCLCMPIAAQLPPEVGVSTAPFIQLVKNFNHPRTSAHSSGYKKK